MLDSEDEAAAVSQLAACWRLVLPPLAVARVVAYLRELIRWNVRVNLTGARGVDEVIGEHLPDCFAVAQLCRAGDSVVDIGSGGGLPGFPLALIRPDCNVTLVEPRAKRVAFLRAVGRESGPSSVTVVRARAEELEGGRYEVAVSRATFAPEEWVAVAERLLAPRGMAIVLAARPLRERLGAAAIRSGVEYKTASGSPRWVGGYCFT